MSERPIIIKKVKKSGHKHHGGSWKVAYADFVTAMMAFFLLMWLLASVNPKERAEVAGYFKRPLRSILTKGQQPGGDQIMSQSDGSSHPGVLAAGSDSLSGHYETMQLERLREELEEQVKTDPLLKQFKDQLRFELTQNGLSIQIVDKQNRPMFNTGSAILQPYTVDILHKLAQYINDVPNRITVSGHTDALPYAGGESGYSNWELSADRANAARRELVAGGIQEGKILRVEGLASTSLLIPSEPYDPANRRISILLLNQHAEQALQGPDIESYLPRAFSDAGDGNTPTSYRSML
ncbi:MAG TPA: flagellar motor protein MotB [Rhodothermales bacterium]|nr:flagellar motor protein MotB [Rhodothermales bacterium]